MAMVRRMREREKEKKTLNDIVGETCCQLESGDYGCCPLRTFHLFFFQKGKLSFLADAVCCSKSKKKRKMKYCDMKVITVIVVPMGINVIFKKINVKKEYRFHGLKRKQQFP